MQQQPQSNDYLVTQPIGRLVARFAVPCVLSMLVSALYNIVDQIFIGQSVGYLGNAATTVVYPFTVVALALALIVGDGCASQLSLSLGSGDRETGHKCVGNSLLLSILIGAALLAAGLLFTDPILRLFGVTQASYGYARDYMLIITLGMPFYVVTNGVNAAIRADGAPAYAMVSTGLGAVMNLILDPVAIFVLDMGVKGAAWATILGQIASCALSLLYFRRPKSFRLTRESFRLSGSVVKKIGRQGLPSFIIQLAIVVIIGVANNLIGVYGPQSKYGADIPLSVIGIVMKVFGIVVAVAVGIGLGGQPIAGFNFGAGNYRRVFATYRYIILANVVVGAASMLVFELCPQAVVRLFGSESALYNEFANLCFRVFLSGILLTCVQKASSIFLQAIGRPGKSALLSLSRDVIFFVPVIVVLAGRFGVTGMLWAAPIADVLAAVLTFVLVGTEYHKLPRQTEHEEEPLRRPSGAERLV